MTGTFDQSNLSATRSNTTLESRMTRNRSQTRQSVSPELFMSRVDGVIYDQLCVCSQEVWMKQAIARDIRSEQGGWATRYSTSPEFRIVRDWGPTRQCASPEFSMSRVGGVIYTRSFGCSQEVRMEQAVDRGIRSEQVAGSTIQHVARTSDDTKQGHNEATRAT